MCREQDGNKWGKEGSKGQIKTKQKATAQQRRGFSADDHALVFLSPWALLAEAAEKQITANSNKSGSYKMCYLLKGDAPG